MNDRQDANPVEVNGKMNGKMGGSASPSSSTEVEAPPRRRRFTLEHKRRVVQEADACTDSGQIGALLRREGLCSSHLSTWRKLFARGPNPQGRKPKSHDKQEVERLEAENARLAEQLRPNTPCLEPLAHPRKYRLHRTNRNTVCRSVAPSGSTRSTTSRRAVAETQTTPA